MTREEFDAARTSVAAQLNAVQDDTKHPGRVRSSESLPARCYCGHVRHIKGGLCRSKGCRCLIYRPKPTDPGVVTRAGGEALPSQGQSEGTP